MSVSLGAGSGGLLRERDRVRAGAGGRGRAAARERRRLHGPAGDDGGSAGGVHEPRLQGHQRLQSRGEELRLPRRDVASARRRAPLRRESLVRAPFASQTRPRPRPLTVRAPI